LEESGIYGTIILKKKVEGVGGLKKYYMLKLLDSSGSG